MKAFNLATLFLPEWALPWVVLFACAAWVIGARPLAVAASAVVFAEVILAPLVAPWIEALPDWALFGLLVLFVLTLFHGILVLIFGEETAGQVTGTYIVRLLDLLLLGPFRLVGFLLRTLGGRRP